MNFQAALKILLLVPFISLQVASAPSNDVDCEDSTGMFLWNVEKNKRKKCKWVSKKPEITAFRCGLREKSENTRLWDVCPATCATVGKGPCVSAPPGPTDPKPDLTPFEQRYGRQASDEIIQMYKQNEREFTGITAHGMNYLPPVSNSGKQMSFNPPFGINTRDEAISYCVTYCEDNPIQCQGFHMGERFSEPDEAPLGNRYTCVIFNSEAGPVFQLPFPKLFPSKTVSYLTSLFTKTEAVLNSIPTYTPCNVPKETEVPLAISLLQQCQIDPMSDPNCALLTPDFMQYIYPAVGCLAQTGGSEMVDSCLTCMMIAQSSTSNPYPQPNEYIWAEMVCHPDKNIFTGEGLCATMCPIECIEQNQVAMNCVAGHLPYASNNGYRGGSITRDYVEGLDPYVCPSKLLL